MKLFCLHPDDYSFELVEKHPKSVAVVIDCHRNDRALILGGNGKNAACVLDLAHSVMPREQGLTLGVEFTRDAMERGSGPIDFGRHDALPAPVALLLVQVVQMWQVLMGLPVPKVKVERCKSAQVYLVNDRLMPSEMMKFIRKIVGWSCFIHGRHGFIEWERGDKL